VPLPTTAVKATISVGGGWYGGVRSCAWRQWPAPPRRHADGRSMATDYENPGPPKPTKQQFLDAPTTRCKQVDQVDHREHGDSPMHPRYDGDGA
jgi:hypothetical protein